MNAQECPVVYTDYSFQPAAQMYIARDRLPIRLEGTVETRSGMDHDGWFQRIRDDYAQLDAASRESVDAWLRECNAAQALQLEIGVRLRRVGLHVAVER